MRFFILLCLFGINFQFKAVAQERFLKRAQDEIVKGNLAKAYENLATYEKKEGKNASFFYVKAVIEANEVNDYLKLDTAFLDLTTAELELSKLENEKDKEELCKNLGFCVENIKMLFNRLDSTLSQSYLSNENLAIVSSYLVKYPKSTFYNDMISWRNKLAYKEVCQINTEDGYKSFIITYPQAAEINEAKLALWKVAFQNATSINTTESYKLFIKNYSNAPQVRIALKNIENIDWGKIQSSNDIDDFTAYIGKYPKSDNSILAKEKIEKITWDKTLSENSINGFRKFINEFPNSKNILQAKERLENMSWNAIVDSKILSDFEKFIVEFKQSKYIDAANLKIKELKSDVLPYLNAHKKYQLFNVSTNNFVDNVEYDQMLIIEKGKFIVTKYNKRGIIDENGNVIQQITYDCIGDFKNGYSRISIGGKFGFIKSDGELVIQPTLSSIYEIEHKGYIVSKEIEGHTLFAFADTTLHYTIPFNYDDITALPTGFIGKKGNIYQLLDENGKMVNSFNYTNVKLGNETSSFSNAVFIVENKSKYGLTDYKGKLIMPVIYKNIISDKTGKYLIVTGADDKVSLIDSSKNILVPPGPFDIYEISNDIYAVTNKEYGEKHLVRLYNVKLKKYLNTKPFQDVSRKVSEDLLAVLINNKVGYINVNGDLIIEPIYEKSTLGYEEGEDDGEGEGDIDNNIMQSFYNECGYVDVSKNSIEDRIWKNNFDFSEGLTVIQIGDKYGYMNKKGQIVIPIIYNSATAFTNGIAEVSINENGKIINNLINSKGEILIPDFYLQSFSKDQKFCFGFRMLDDDMKEFYRYNLKDGGLETISDSFTSLSYYVNYTKGVFNNAEVYLSQKNVPLMSTDIDFSDFESKKLVNSASLYMYNDKERSKAFDLLKNAIELDPTNKLAYLQLARTYKESENYSEAIQYFDKAIQLEEDNFSIMNEKATYCYEKKYYREAIETYEKMAYKNTQDYSFYFNKGYAESQIGQTDKSIESYSAYLSYYPNSSAFNNRGVCYDLKGWYQKAIDDYTSAIKLGKNETKESIGLYFNNRGSIFRKLNKKLEACIDFKKAADLGNANAINNYRYCK